MRSIHISTSLEVKALVEKIYPIAVLSIEHPGARTAFEGRAPRLVDAGITDVHQRIQVYWDTEGDHVGGPTPRTVRSGLRFLLRHGKNATRPLVVHCRQGKARSVAMALAYLVAANPDKSIAECIAHLKAMRPQAAPNIRVIRHADAYLGLGGALEAAVLADPLFTENRARSQASRDAWAEKNPTKVPRLRR